MWKLEISRYFRLRTAQVLRRQRVRVLSKRMELKDKSEGGGRRLHSGHENL